MKNVFCTLKDNYFFKKVDFYSFFFPLFFDTSCLYGNDIIEKIFSIRICPVVVITFTS